MKNDREFTGTLLGFDDFVSESRLSAIGEAGETLILVEFIDMVLDDVTE